MNRFYAPWVRAGKPYRACTPIAEVVAKLKAARPEAARLNLFGSIGDLAHLTAATPKDHTPYSQTGWPDPSPYGIGFATDIMHRPDLGLDCNVIVRHWLAEARAGRLPWLKYIIWQATIYHARDGFKPGAAADHFDHAHMSARTDHVDTHIGDFDPLGDFMPGITDRDAQVLIWRMEAVARGRTSVISGPSKGEPVELNIRALEQDKMLAALAEKVGMDEAEMESIKAAAREGALAGAEAALTPEALADAIPVELAADVVRLLGEREAAADRARADVLDG